MTRSLWNLLILKFPPPVLLNYYESILYDFPHPGFLGNGSHCKEISQHESGFLLISQGVVILRLPLDGKLGKPISVAQMAIGLDNDCAEGRIYWGDISAKKIMSSKYDGTDVKPFITEGKLVVLKLLLIIYQGFVFSFRYFITRRHCRRLDFTSSILDWFGKRHDRSRKFGQFYAKSNDRQQIFSKSTRNCCRPS